MFRKKVMSGCNMKIMEDAFQLAALDYINRTHFGYHLTFDIDEAIQIAVSHFLRRK